MECDLQWACSACPESQWEPLMEGWTSVSAVILPLRSSSLPSSLPYVSPWGYTSAPTGWIALWLSGRQWVFHNWLVSLCAQATRKLSDVITRLPLLTCAHTVLYASFSSILRKPRHTHLLPCLVTGLIPWNMTPCLYLHCTLQYLPHIQCNDDEWSSQTYCGCLIFEILSRKLQKAIIC